MSKTITKEITTELLDEAMHNVPQAKLDRVNDFLSASEGSIAWVAAISKATEEGYLTNETMRTIANNAAALSKGFMKKNKAFEEKGAKSFLASLKR